MQKRSLLFFTLLFLSGEASANWGAWQRAKDAYDTGKFDEALSAFLSASDVSPTYHYNLGSVYYRLGRQARARAHFERSLSLQGRDPDTRHNLELVLDALASQIGRDRLDPASTWIERRVDYLSLEEVRGVVGLSALLFVMFLFPFYFKRRTLRSLFLSPASLIGACLCICSVLVFVAKKNALASPPAFAVEQALIRSGPGNHFVELSKLDAGMKIRLTGEASTDSATGLEWLQIRFSPGKVGWVTESSLFKI